MKYRADINTLRAISVAFVVLYHFNVWPFTSGFIGVDIFFVISGFLMTNIIVTKTSNNNFSLIEFYESRAKRLIPALACVCIALIIFGYFFLDPEGYRKLAGHAATSINFTSNLAYAKEIGYFDENATEKWLLHTWSLSVEWQFYILFPIIILLTKKLRINPSYTLLSIFIASLIYSTYLHQLNEDKSYYSLLTRAWELIAGGLAATAQHKFKNIKTPKYLDVILILSIIAFACQPKISSIWPGPLTLIPIALAWTLLLINTQRKIHHNIIVHEIGASSYSIYLWHWPILVLISHFNAVESPSLQVTGILSSIAIGVISKKLIEDRFTHRIGKNGINLAAYIVLIALIYSASMYVVQQKGFPERMDKSIADIGINPAELQMPERSNGYCFKNYNSEKDAIPSAKENECWIGDSAANETVLLFGDSFAGQWEPFWDDIGKSEHIKIRSVTTNWCYPSLGANYTGPENHPGYKQCLINRTFLENHAKDFATIIIAGHWSQIYDKFGYPEIEKLIHEMESFGKRIIIMPSPTIFDQNILSKFKFYNFNNINFDTPTLRKEHDKKASLLNDKIELSISKDSIFIRREYLFNANDTTSIGIPYSLDGNHISIYGAHASFDKIVTTDYYKTLLGHIRNAD